MNRQHDAQHLRQHFAAGITAERIYPRGSDGDFALGSPDGRMLRDGEMVEIRLGEVRVMGFIEHQLHSTARFVAEDGSVCGLCAGMWIGVPRIALRE